MSPDPVPTCVVVRPGDAYAGKQSLSYVAGISAEPVGATGLCMHLLTIPLGGRANAHLHAAHETAIYVVSGESGMWFGPTLAEPVTVRAGEFLCIPAGVPYLPYLPYNPGPDPVVAVIARTDPNEQESVILRPDLDHVRSSKVNVIGLENWPSA